MPTFKTMKITPAVAAGWLDRNTGNRNLRKSRAAKYAADMLEGRWQQNGDTFKFDTSGRLIDGQHRARAIVDSGVTITGFVVEGLPAEAAQTLDAGATRSPGDALFFAGENHNHAKDIAAALNAWHAWTSGYYTDCHAQPGGQAKLSNAAMVQAWEANPRVAAAAVEAKALYQRGLRLPVGAITVAMIELRALDFDVANDFFDRVVDLRTTGKGDPIHTLISRMQDEASGGRRIFPSTALFMLFRAWNAHVKNERLLKMQFGSSESGWSPIPTPVKVPKAFSQTATQLKAVA